MTTRLHLPVFPLPAQGEVLTSYVIRLAVANELRPMRLTALLRLQSFWKRDPDLSATYEDVRLVANAAELPPEQVWACSLRPWVATLHGEIRPDVTPRFVALAGKHRGVQGMRGLPICVACVRESGVILREWRLTTSVICERHGVPLVDTCPLCQHPVHHVRPHLAQRGAVAVHRPDYCWHCQKPYPVPDLVPEQKLTAASVVQGMMRQAVTEGKVDWCGLWLTASDFQAVLESVLRRHYPSKAETGAAKWRPETASVAERLHIVTAGGMDLVGGLHSMLTRWRARGILPHQVREMQGLPDAYRDLITLALTRDGKGLPAQIQGRRTFVFSDRQWRSISRVIPTVARISRHGHPVRQILRAWFTRHLKGARQNEWQGTWTGRVSYPAMSRRIKGMADDGTLDRVIEVMLRDLPECLPVLTAPAVVCALHQLDSRFAQELWHLMVGARVGAWCEEAFVLQHKERA